jgi:hypothetical protein
MKRRLFVTTLIAGVMALPALTTAQPGTGKGPGAGPGAGGMQQKFTRERLFGSPLMTLEERQEHQRQMWNAKTVQERQKIRDENRTKMLARAQQQNYKIDQNLDDTFFVPATQADG